MIFRTPELEGIEIQAVEQINKIRKNLYHGLQTSKRWTGFLRRNMLAKAIQGSNTIEGYNVSFEEAVAVVEGEKPDIAEQTRRALEGYRAALSYVLRLADDSHVTFNEELIRSLHYMMMSYNLTKRPGQWRPGPVYVRREPSGERVYEGPDAEEVPQLMRELVEGIREGGDSVPSIVRAALAHLNLVMIHPFSDGNGRMGRCIQTLILSWDGVLEQPFSSIEEYLGSRGNTEAYYSILGEVGQGKWHPERDARPWVRFCLKAHLQQANTLERRFKEIARLWSDLEAEINRKGLPERVIAALYEAAIGFRVKSERYRTQAEISSQVAARDLRMLVNKGLLSPRGEKRGRIYVASPDLFAIREGAREPRARTEDVFIQQLKLFDD